ncbi:hypothetical protein BOTNAR_0075g00230 [Botryotinia narcissicola]|uniref:Uncharacterized protein n=1 Tax=Botryotinia narcissicola TaxID=278944 RepID=A0A4Z1J975_9HELO|nr:hypothetical protein BOTNAR_0075g00230 [Botryotinia narcissicola]
MVLFLSPGLRPHWKFGKANIEKQELFTPKKPVGNSGRKFPLPPHILHRLNLHNSCTSFPSKTSSAPSLLPSLMKDSPTSLHSADSGVWPGKRPAEGTADERPGKKAKYGFTSHIDFEVKATDADDEDSDFEPADTPSDREEEVTTVASPVTVSSSIAEPVVASPLASPFDPQSEFDFSDTPSSKRRALTPPSPILKLVSETVVKSIPATSRWDFTLTAKQAGYVYNPRKSMTDLSDRFATPSDSDSTLDTDDSESDFNSTPNRSSSPARARASSPSPLPLPLPLPQWKYHHNPIDRNNPATPPSIGTKRKMEQAYAEWHQGEMDTPRASSCSPITSPADTPQSVDFNEVESGTAQYDSQSEQENMEPSRASSYSYHTISSTSPQIPHSSTSTSETTVFPTDLPSPSVPCRLEPYSPILDHLTAQYIAQGPHPQLPHVNHAAMNQRNATHILNKHQDDRAPFVRAASRRLQAVLGVRNDLPFDLLMGTGKHDASNLVVGRDGTLVDLGLKDLERREEVTRGAGAAAEDESGNGEDFARDEGVMSGEDIGNNQENMSTDRDMNTNANANEAHNANTTAQYLQDIHASFNTLRSSSHTPSTHHSSHHQQAKPQKTTSIPAYESPTQTQRPFFPPSVNPYTGEGLREYLLTRASMTGSVKRECRSISFHDFTPDVRTGDFRNQLLVHFGVDGISSCERVEVVELGLPDITGTLHPWLSIFIQRPLVTATSPSPALHSTSTTTTTPPNFPSPTPTTWLCIAVPISNITSYPIQPDTTIPPSLLESTFSHSQHGLPTKKIAKRQDYDFSFQGTPIFEFSTRALFPQPENPFPNTAPTADFLSIEVPRPYDPSDPYLEFLPQISRNPVLLQREVRKYARAAGVAGEELHTYGDVMVDESGVDVSEEVSPNEGIWWCEFYRGITRDRIRWERVKRCMGRGRCRVVLRWQDVPDEMKRLGGRSSASTTSGIGLGVSRKISEAERVMQEMSRGNMGAMGKKRRGRKSMQTSHANTSSSVGLGVMNTNMGSHSHSHAYIRSRSGEALRDSLRARAIGNRISFNGDA